uniref:Uncharacterized protein n=1 Tax=Leersia perrieri TaxID=77586 RepID=A0A0D9WLX0_9ORYZ
MMEDCKVVGGLGLVNNKTRTDTTILCKGHACGPLYDKIKKSAPTKVSAKYHMPDLTKLDLARFSSVYCSVQVTRPGFTSRRQPTTVDRVKLFFVVKGDLGLLISERMETLYSFLNIKILKMIKQRW